MGIYELVDQANAGNPRPMRDWLEANKQMAADMEFELEVHHAIAPAGSPKYFNTQCDGRLHDHPDVSWVPCLPYVHRDGLTLHMLCDQCAHVYDPLNLQD